MNEETKDFWHKVFGYKLGDLVVFNDTYPIKSNGKILLLVKKGDRAMVLEAREGGELVLSVSKNGISGLRIIGNEKQVTYVRSAKVGLS